jgi:hypothetical protein
MSSTTTTATPVMSENRGSGNRRMTDWPSRVFRIHMTNFVDDWKHLCMLILSYQSQAMLASTARAPQKWLNGPWERVANTKMEKGKMMPSPRLYKPMSNEAAFMVFSSKLTRREGFLEHKSTYRKQKVTSTPHVHVVELKRQLRREILGDLKAILEFQGIQFTDIAGVISEG